MAFEFKLVRKPFLLFVIAVSVSQNFLSQPYVLTAPSRLNGPVLDLY